MRWDFGKIYKQIRQSKGITQQEVCGEFVARSTLANFERGISVPNFETMVFFLNQLDMSIEEFRYICHEYHPSERQELLYSLQNLPTYPKLDDMQKLFQKCQSYLLHKHDIPIKHLSSILAIYIQLYDGKDFTNSTVLQESARGIWHYLEKQDTWYESDLRLFRTILYSFPLDNLDILSNKILESLKKYKNYRNIKPLQIALLMSLSEIYFKAKKFHNCCQIIKYAIELAKQQKHYVYLASAQVRLGICQKDETLIDKGLTLLKLTEEDDLVAVLEKEVEQFYRQK